MRDIEAVVALIEGAERIALSTHISPDPDAIGSLLACHLMLKAQGKQTVLLNDDPVPPRLKFLPDSGLIADHLPKGFTPDLFIALDSSDAERLGKSAVPLLANEALPRVVIDHHMTNAGYGQANIVLADCAATAQVLLELLDALNLPLTPDIAVCLAVGLVGDTISFSTRNVTPESLEAAARLVRAGADLNHINDVLFNRTTYPELRVWGLGASRAKLENGVSWAALPYEVLAEAGLQSVSTSRLVGSLLAVDAAAIAATFTEEEKGQTRVSMRARAGHDVASIALSLGGGGHQLAAGCVIEDAPDQAAAKVIPLLQAHAAQQRVESPAR